MVACADCPCCASIKGSQAISALFLAPKLPIPILHGPVEETGWHNSTNQSGLGRTVHKTPQRWTTRSATCHQLSCGWILRKKKSKRHPNVLMDGHVSCYKQNSTPNFSQRIPETDSTGHPSGERAIRCAIRNFDRKSLPSQLSIGNKTFAIANLCFICTIMSCHSGHHEFEPTQL